MSKIILIELDILKPNNLSIVDMALSLSEIKGLSDVEIKVKEIEKEVEKVSVIITGTNLASDVIYKTIESLGCAVHNIDRVIVKK